MRTLISTLIVVAAGILSSNIFSEGADDDLPGVKGRVIRVEKNRQNAARVEQVMAEVGDAVEIDWLYSVVPGSIPTSVSASADGQAVKLSDVRHIERPGDLAGGGMLGAFFRAERKGEATVTFTINSVGTRGEEVGVTLKCKIEVQ